MMALKEIQTHIAKALFRDVLYDLFGRLRSERKRAIGKRQIQIVRHLLDFGKVDAMGLYKGVIQSYSSLQNPWKAFARDVIYLRELGAIAFERVDENKVEVQARLEWPTEITESEFFKRVRAMPKAKTYQFLQKGETRAVAN